jgi:ABC-type antimicrobial peptide transport system permease subunit
MVLCKVGTWILAGSAIGLFIALAFGRVAAFMLYQLQGSDPAVPCGATIVMALVALIAGCIPACRASGIDSMEALRYE